MKHKFTEKFILVVTAESQVKFFSPGNVSGVLQQNSVAQLVYSVMEEKNMSEFVLLPTEAENGHGFFFIFMHDYLVITTSFISLS